MRSRDLELAGAKGSQGTHLTSSRPWYSECVPASAIHLATRMPTSSGSSMRTSALTCEPNSVKP